MFDVDPIINKVRFYTQNQIWNIKKQRFQFHKFIRQHHLTRYVRYINCKVKPARLRQDEWVNCVLPLKEEAKKLMAVMRGVQPNR